MKKALIIYGSTTGNTESMSEIVGAGLKDAGMEVEIKEVTNAKTDDLTSYDLVLMGCPAYGDDEIELQDDFVDFYDQMDGIKLEGKKFAVFAPGDTSYEHFCGSVDMLEGKIEELGGTVVVEGLKVEGDPSDSDSDIKEWAGRAAGSL